MCALFFTKNTHYEGFLFLFLFIKIKKVNLSENINVIACVFLNITILNHHISIYSISIKYWDHSKSNLKVISHKLVFLSSQWIKKLPDHAGCTYRKYIVLMTEYRPLEYIYIKFRQLYVTSHYNSFPYYLNDLLPNIFLSTINMMSWCIGLILCLSQWDLEFIVVYLLRPKTQH